MTLVVIYKNTLVSDRCAILKDPHAEGLQTQKSKMYVHPDKHFAFACAGNLLSQVDQIVLGLAIQESFKAVGKEANTIPLLYSSGRAPICFLLTKKSTYRLSRNRESVELQRLDNDLPVGDGTGMTIAQIALMEGVAMKDIAPFVASMEHTVSENFDMITRKELKVMKL